MGLHHLWISADPRMSENQRKATDARGAARRAAWPAIGRGLRAAVLRLARRVARARRRRRNEAELARLSDRMLADIGLRRSDIANIARRAADEPAPLALAEIHSLEVRGAGRAEVIELPAPCPDQRRRRPSEGATRRPAADACRVAAN